MWRQIVLPVIVVGVSWLTMSIATTMYVLSLDASYERVFEENVASIDAAGLLQEEIWRLHVELVATPTANFDWSPRLKVFDKHVQKLLTDLDVSSTTLEEQSLADRIRALIQQYREQLQAALESGSRPTQDELARMILVARQLSEDADEIRRINDELARSASARRIRIRNVVLWGRSLASFLVSATGIAVGWWTANRLQRSMAQIQVTLHDPALASPGDLGTVQVGSRNELASIQQQVGLVVDRLRRSGEELQAARQEVVRAERLAAIGGLAAGVAHELRNPLTSVKLLLQHAASRGGDAVVASPRMGLILDEIERMEATIQGLLDFSRPARPQRKLHDLRETLQRAMNLVAGRAEKQQVRTEMSLGARPMMVNGDPQQLHQVFVNLLINGIEAMPQGGNLSVVLTDDAYAGELVVEIHDTGGGIPSELLPRLFEPFASNKERGTGLGLAVSRRIVEEHGGSVKVQPRTPVGTTFCVALPQVAAAVSRAS